MSSYQIPYLSVARFTGDDAGDFLQSQLSADILALEPGENTLACYCTPKGQVLGLLLLERHQGAYLAAGHGSLLPGILQRLGMFVMRSEVRIEDAPEMHVQGFSGPEFAITANGGGLTEEVAWKAGELRAGITWLNVNSTEKFIPQMLGFEEIGAVSFKKGCYPGQEIVARARYLGKVKRKPAIIEVQGSPGVVDGSKIRIRRGDDWMDAIVIDHAPDGDSCVIFSVARTEPELPVDEAEIEGQSYLCATT